MDNWKWFAAIIVVSSVVTAWAVYEIRDCLLRIERHIREIKDDQERPRES